MTSPHRRFLGLLALAAFAAAACTGGGGASTEVSATPASASPSAAATVSSGAWIVKSTSKATARVREQLVGVSAPSDAVLVATGAAGAFKLNDDGTFSADSRITFDLTTLSSDQPQRDNFVKMSTLAVGQSPIAVFVPTKASGLALPLASSGTFAFTLSGRLTIHGTTTDVTFAVQATRDGDTLTATAAAEPSLTFEEFGMTAPSVPFRVVSVVDQIRLVVDLSASLAE